MNPRDAQQLGLRSHDRVDVVSRRGRVRGVELRLTEIIAPGQVFMPFHYFETNVERSDAERVRPDLARAELQAVRGAGGDAREQRHEEELVVVGNGMAGVACVEQILKYTPRFRDHDLRRRDARQLQPHPAVVGAGRREVGRRDRAQRYRLVPAQRHRAAAGRADRRRSIATAHVVIGDDGSATPLRQADPRHRQQRLRPADPRRRQRRTSTCSARWTTRARCWRKSRPGLQGGGDRRRTAGPGSGARAAGARLRRHGGPPVPTR